MKRFLPLLLVVIEGFTELSNPSVLNGEAFIEHSGASWQIHASDKAVIQWDKFSLSEVESARFHQPSSFSVVVNRCLSEKTEILGSLFANGHVVLVNPNGVYFGENSWIDTAKFTASTHDLFEGGFSGENLCFEKEGNGPIAAYGTLIAREGDILLLSNNVVYGEGLSATKGNICVGSTYLKKEDEFGWIRVKPRAGIDVQGVIKANEVTLISDGNLFDLAINHEGLIEANTISFEGGKVLFQGKVETDLGGEVNLLGKEIEVTGSSELVAPEGRIFIGGGFQGEDLKKPNADMVLVKGTINVSGAKGGEAILWSEKRTDFSGHVDARGETGDGGLIEISSRGALNYKGTVSAAAPNGKAGKLLLDPSSILIGPGPSAPAFPTTPPGTYDPLIAGAFLASSDVIAALNGGTDVTILTASGAGGIGDVTLLAGMANDITWMTVNSLSIVADHNITILANLGGAMAGGTIQLIANNDLFIGPPASGDTSLLQTTGMVDLKATNGNIKVTSNDVISLDSGIADCAYYDVRCAGNITLDSTTANGNSIFQSSSATQSLIVCGGNLIQQSSANGSASIHALGGPISINVGGNFIVNQQSINNSGWNIGTAGTASTVFVGGNFVVNRTNSGNAYLDVAGDTTIIVQGSLSINDTNPALGGLVGIQDSAAGNLILDVGGDIDLFFAREGGFKGILATGGDLTVLTGGSLSMNDTASLMAPFPPIVGSFTNDVFIQCDQDCVINGTSTISVGAPTSTIVVVVDNDFPTAPGIGPGRFVLGPNATVSRFAQVPVQIFTSQQSLNTISGRINSASFSPGALYTDTDQERWGVYYPDAFVNPNSPFFTVFYKDTPALLTAIAAPVFEFDISRYLHPYDEYISLANRFFERYFEGEEYQPTAFQPYFLRKRTLRYTSFTMDRNNIEYSFIY